MKKTTIVIVMAMLCLNFLIKAQENKAIDVVAKGLQIGQQVSDLTLTNIHNYKDASGKSATTAKISDFKGKLLILDFWATWCQPCIAMLPRMDSLQKQFDGKIQFLSATYQTASDVLPILAKIEQAKGKKYNLPILTDDKKLRQLFPHVYLPHYVWINQLGKVVAITGTESVTAEKINNALVNQTSNFIKKTDMHVQYNKDLPLLAANNLGAANKVYYYSLITGCIEGLNTGFNTRYKTTSMLPRKVTFTNLSPELLFSNAFGEGNIHIGRNRVILEIKDTIALGRIGKADYKKWRAENAFCYELIVPPNMSNAVYRLMREDLTRFFKQYLVGFEQKNTKCLVLVKTSDFGKIDLSQPLPDSTSKQAIKFVNRPFSNMLYHCSSFYMQYSKLPIVDGTGYLGNVNLALSNMKSINSINLELAKYGLTFIEKEMDIDMLVFKDNPQYAANDKGGGNEK